MAKLKILTVDGKIVRGPGGGICGHQSSPFTVFPETGVGGTSVTITGENFTSSLDEYTKLLLHGEGVGASIVDSSPSAKTGIQALGGATQSTTKCKFGSKSLAFLASTDYVTVPTSDDFNFGSGSFTVDWWEYRNSYVNYSKTICRDNSASYPPFSFGYYTLGVGYLYMTSNGTSWDIASEKKMGNPIVNEWTHYAVVRDVNNFYIFQNGVLTDSWTSSLAIKSSTNPLCIGGSGSPYNFNGYIDELRISKGIARWTSNFIPPAMPYPEIEVKFDGVKAKNVIVADAQTITATTPGHLSGSVPVSVTTASETITADSAYTYTADSRIVSGGIITYTDANGLNPRSSPAYAGGYTVHTFKTSGWLEVQGGTIPTAQVLVVGSGGKCDRDVANTTYPGGGGGGQVIYNASYGITSSTPAIVGVTTQNSSFNTLVALKGNNGYSLGHGGSSGSGYAGGSYYQYGGGGGGGAGGAGANASGYNTGAAGGAGISNAITGTSVVYGKGGNGSDSSHFNGGYIVAANTGGGGMYGNYYPGAAGIVVIRYPSSS